MHEALACMTTTDTGDDAASTEVRLPSAAVPSVLLVQVDDDGDDSFLPTLTAGAMGRLECTGDDGVLRLDWSGRLYTGYLYPMATTAVVLSYGKGGGGAKVDGITHDFCRLVPDVPVEMKKKKGAAVVKPEVKRKDKDEFGFDDEVGDSDSSSQSHDDSDSEDFSRRGSRKRPAKKKTPAKKRKKG